AVLRAPLIKGRRADAQLPTQLRHRQAGFHPLERFHDLTVRESRPLHLVELLNEKILLLNAPLLRGDYRTVLICRARALEPAVIELPYSGDDALAASEPGYLARVEGIEPAATDTLALQLSTANDVPFLPGQYVNIAPTAEFQRSYSMANPPGGRYLKFFIALHPGGRFSEWLQSAAVGDRVELSAPRGTFYLRSNAKPKVMVAGGTGLAPL